MMNKTIQFRAHPDGDWMSMGVSYITEGSFVVPDGMELDARSGSMRWHPDTPVEKRDFEKREITFEYSVPIEPVRKYKGQKPKDLTPDERNEILFGHLLDDNGNIK